MWARPAGRRQGVVLRAIIGASCQAPAREGALGTTVALPPSPASNCLAAAMRIRDVFTKRSSTVPVDNFVGKG